MRGPRRAAARLHLLRRRTGGGLTDTRPPALQISQDAGGSPMAAAMVGDREQAAARELVQLAPDAPQARTVEGVSATAAAGRMAGMCAALAPVLLQGMRGSELARVGGPCGSGVARQPRPRDFAADGSLARDPPPSIALRSRRPRTGWPVVWSRGPRVSLLLHWHPRPLTPLPPSSTARLCRVLTGLQVLQPRHRPLRPSESNGGCVAPAPVPQTDPCSPPRRPMTGWQMLQPRRRPLRPRRSCHGTCWTA